MTEQLPQGEKCGVRKEETALSVRSKHLNSYNYKLTVKRWKICMSVFICFRGRCGAAIHRMVGAIA